MTTINQPFHTEICNHWFQNNYARTSAPKEAWRHRYSAAKKGKPTAAAPAAHTRYLSSPAATTLHGKIQGFVLRLRPQNISPMQHSCSHYNAFRSISVANLHISTHVATSDDNNQPAIPLPSATTDSKTRIVTKHAQEQPKQLAATVTEEATHRVRNGPQPQPPHTRGTFHRRLQPLYKEKYKVSCSGFLPNTKPTKPMQHSCSHCNAFRRITCCKPAHIYARGNIRWQQSTSHSTAIRNHRFQDTHSN